MAGHSKWKNIQHRKGKQDALRSKLFNRLSKEIYIAVRQGGEIPEMNPRLKAAIQKAKQNNMPNSNIENAIKKATGNLDGIQYEEIVYEGYGPGGTAVMVQCLTDNRNRTAAEIRYIFNKNGGNLGESGCVSYLFHKKGVLEIPLAENQADEDTLMMEALELGAEDFTVDDGVAEIIVPPEAFETIKDHFEQKNTVMHSAELTLVPSTTVQLSEDDAVKMLQLMNALEDCDDVQDVHANFDIDEDMMQKHG